MRSQVVGAITPALAAMDSADVAPWLWLYWLDASTKLRLFDSFFDSTVWIEPQETSNSAVSAAQFAHDVPDESFGVAEKH
jgi:hypothetical protein